MALVYKVYLQGTDPDDPDYFGYVGERASLLGAQSLAEKKLKQRIYGYFARGQSMGRSILETSNDGPRARLVYDHGSTKRDVPRRQRR